MPARPKSDPGERRVIAMRLLALRRQLGLTQEQFAEDSAGHLSRTEVCLAESKRGTLATSIDWPLGVSCVIGGSMDDAHAYLQGDISLTELMKRCERSKRVGAVTHLFRPAVCGASPAGDLLTVDPALVTCPDCRRER